MAHHHDDIDNLELTYVATVKPRSQVVYLLCLLFITAAIVSLPLIKTDISIRTTGVIRPENERTEVKPAISGIISELYFKEGQPVKKGDVIALLRDNQTAPKTILNNFELKQRRMFISDLQLLTSPASNSADVINRLQSPLYKQQFSKFLYQQAEQQVMLKKAAREAETAGKLVNDKVIAPIEQLDKQAEAERLNAAFTAFKNEQLSIWQQDLQRYNYELSQLNVQQQQINAEKNNYQVIAPLDGVIQQINTYYAGGFIQAGEQLCIISPESNMIAECYVATRDVGLLKTGQQARFQVDAFDYNHFGILTGKIIAIDNDYTIVDNKPFFKVRCSFDQKQLYLKNGFTGQLKKGLTVQSRFIVVRRSLWQLLFDRLDDWFNPSAPTTTAQ